MAKICKHCGSLLSDDALICSQCGTIVDDGEDAEEKEFNWDEADIDFSGEAEQVIETPDIQDEETESEPESLAEDDQAADEMPEPLSASEGNVSEEEDLDTAPETETEASKDAEADDDDDYDDYDDYDEEAEEERAAEEAELQRKKSNRITLIGVLVFAILLVGVFVGFIGVTNYRNSPKRAAGTYIIYTIDGYTPDTLNEYYDLDLSEDDMIIVLNKDLTGTLTIEDEEEDLTWTLDRESSTLTMIIEETSYISATYYTNGYLEMTVSSSTYIMKLDD